jgi:hypothetical protein
VLLKDANLSITEIKNGFIFDLFLSKYEKNNDNSFRFSIESNNAMNSVRKKM